METTAPARVAVIEADGIQRWILGASSELRILRGGSLLLDQTFASIEEELRALLGDPDPVTRTPPAHGWQLLVRSSGALSLVLSGQHDVEQVRAAVRRVVARELPDLSVRFGSAPWTSSFSEARRAAVGAARALLEVVAPAHVPTTLVCTSCGAASGDRHGRPPGPGADPWHLCRACSRRSRLTHDDTDALVDGVVSEYEVSRIGGTTPSPRWSGYVGVVCADGNAVGQRFARIDDPAELAETSAELARQVTANVRRALERARSDDALERDLPVNLVMQAGDDVRIILPAHVALAAAAAMCNDPTLPGCAGVVITHASMPFLDAHEHAELLLDQDAKRHARSIDPQSPPPVIAFTVESGSRPRDPGGHPDRISAGPYLADQLERLLVVSEQLTSTSSAIRNVCEQLRVGGQVAAREWGHFLTGCSDDDRNRLRSLWDAFGRELDDPWVTDDRRSPMGDLLFLRTLRRQEVHA